MKKWFAIFIIMINIIGFGYVISPSYGTNKVGDAFYLIVIVINVVWAFSSLHSLKKQS
ncbi:hypothetical protein [Bombilactobacillus bombi]|uniref:hypothetical protein n=1 Tax=Bombilactobacillus bombi TaxID=1303590 RepID=UPI0015E5B3FB|nr:hypothetical protein [Bombilactobacillus bombi]